MVSDDYNQPPPLGDVNLYADDPVLMRQARAAGFSGEEHAVAFGAIAGSEDLREAARLANENPPKLHLIDARGGRLDEVEFHPAYHRLMATSIGARLHCATWEPDGGSLNRAIGFYMAAQMEAGHCCPVTMTNAVVPALRLQDNVAAKWLPQVMTRNYDPRLIEMSRKTGVTFGMGMTERQGGTDVRTNSTGARPAGTGGPGAEYVLNGHKWFMSAPMCDAFLVLAQAAGGLTCFLLPRILEDGSRNGMRIDRLKDKLGNRSNASAEVGFVDAHAWAIGEEGRGINTIIEMVTQTRLDCAVSSAALMRQALVQALHHASYRIVFQRKLIDQPLMTQVLADMAVTAEAACALVIRLAASFDRAAGEPSEAAFARLMTPAIKYWVCKMLPGFAYEAMECLGGNGYVEENGMATLYREAPINAIWEGSGNVMCLDVARVAERSPDTVEAVFASLDRLADGQPQLRTRLHELKARFAGGREGQAALRRLVDELVTLTAALLLTHSAPAAVADGFIATRIRERHGGLYGAGATLPGAEILATASAG